MSSLTQRHVGAIMNTFGPPQLALVRGSGASVWDEDGKEYVDWLGGIAVNSLGHAHPALVKAVSDQLATLGHISNFFASGPQVALAEKLLEVTAGVSGGEPGKVFFANSGTEANEAAFKLTRRTGRTHVVACAGGFHGRTMGALALTSKEAYRTPFEPLPGDVTFVPYGDAEALAAAVTDETAAIVVEPIQGEAGVIVPPEGFLASAREIADQHGALLWLDEIQTGVGRTGAWLAADGVRADVVTLAKGLGGGIPIGACVAFGPAAGLLEPGNHGTTFGGNPVAAAAGLAVLATVEDEGLLERVAVLGERLRSALEVAEHVEYVDGRGLLLGVQLAADVAPDVVNRGRAAGLILNAPTPSRIRLAPPLVITDDQVDAFLTIFPDVVAEAMGAHA